MMVNRKHVLKAHVYICSFRFFFIIIVIIKRKDEAKWLKVPECQHTTTTKCEFSLLDTNVYIKTQFRVRAEEGNSTSSWNEVDPFIPFYTGKKPPWLAILFLSSSLMSITSAVLWCSSLLQRPLPWPSVLVAFPVWLSRAF
jgi:hypothetical protein